MEYKLGSNESLLVNSSGDANKLKIKENGDTYLVGVGNYDGTNDAQDTTLTLQEAILAGMPGTLSASQSAVTVPTDPLSLAGAITLHKIAWTGAYSDLINPPSIPDDSRLVHKSGSETITGQKTFNGTNTETAHIIFEKTSSASPKLKFTDSTGRDLPTFEVESLLDGSTSKMIFGMVPSGVVHVDQTRLLTLDNSNITAYKSILLTDNDGWPDSPTDTSNKPIEISLYRNYNETGDLTATRYARLKLTDHINPTLGVTVRGIKTPTSTDSNFDNYAASKKYVDDKVSAVPEYSIALASTSTGAFKSYKLQKGGSDISGSLVIDIPKDFLVKSGSVVDVVKDGDYYYESGAAHTEANRLNGYGVNSTGKHIKLVVNSYDSSTSTGDTYLYIAAQDLVDVYNDGDGIDIDSSNNVNINLDTSNANGLGFNSDTPKKLKLDLATTSSAGAMSAADKTKLDGITAGSEPNMTSITYTNLVTLRNGGNLVPGMQYRITDYDTIIDSSLTNVDADGHLFDVIVVADSTTSLSEDARAIQHTGDNYFQNSDLASWELKYCLDNDTTRFTWANSTNGKGVIYWMKDEFGNECPYDFKNIMFNRKLTNGVLDQSGTDRFVYTFTAYDAPNGEYLDASVISFSSLIDDSTNQCYGNRIGVYSEEYSSDTDWFELNDIVFLNVFDAENDSYFHCYNNTFGNDCFSNTFGNNCNGNSFGNSCYGNSLGVCHSNTFGNNCNGNSFGNGCNQNSFGNYCSNNSFGNSCSNNTFGNSCYRNSLGNFCQYSTFGNNCQYSTFGNYCRQITVFGGVKNCQITGGTSSSNYVQNAEILEGVSGSSSSSNLTITFAKNKSYTQIAALRDGTGTPAQRLVIWDATVQADWDQTTTTAKDYIKNKPENLSDFTNDLGFITSADLPTNTSDLTNDGSDGTSTYVELDELATVATTGDYNDLTNTPTIPAAQVQSNWEDTSGMGEILHKPSFNGTVLEANDWDTALYDLPVITHDVSKTYSDYTSITGIIESPALNTTTWTNTGAHIEIPITPDLVGIEITGASTYETKYAFLVEDQLQSGQTAPPMPTTITAGGTVRVSVPYGEDYIYIQTNNGTYHTRPTSIKLIMLNQEDSGYVHIAGSETITGQKTFTSDVVLWNGSQSSGDPTPYLEFRKERPDDNKHPDWKIRGDGTGSLSFYSSISGADTKQVTFDAEGSVTITGAKNITSLRIGYGNVDVLKGTITANKNITATDGDITATTGNIVATAGSITAPAGDVIAGGNGRFKGLMNDSNSGTGTGHYIMSYQYHSLVDSTNSSTYQAEDTMPVTSKNVVNYVEDYVTTAIGNIPSAYYWANQSVQSSRSYITTPEFKQVTINGSTTDAQSTDHCVMVYDTTNKCLKFTF